MNLLFKHVFTCVLQATTALNMTIKFHLSLLIFVSMAAATPWPGRWNGEWNQPPTRVPSPKSVDGPLLGDGEAGVVLGAAANGRGKRKDDEFGSQTGFTAYISSNSFWLLQADDRGDSHRQGMGGFTVRLLIGGAPALTSTFGQDIANGSVSWTAWNSSAPPPAPSGCSIAGPWRNKAGENMTAVAVQGGRPGEYVFTNPDPHCHPVPGGCHDGWRNASLVPDRSSAAVDIVYHRFERAGCGSECTRPGPAGCDCTYVGRFDSDCQHLSFPTFGRWHRPGAQPPAPPPPLAVLSATTTMKQTQSEAAGQPSVMVTTLVSSVPTPLEMQLETWTFPDGTNHQAGVEPASGACWATRRLNGTSMPVTGAIVSRVLTASDRTEHNSGSVVAHTDSQGGSVIVNHTIPPHGTVQIVHVVLTSYTLGQDKAYVEPLSPALACAENMTSTQVDQVLRQTRLFWARFWNQSRISLPTHPSVEAYWTRAQYFMALASRAGRVAPGLWGPWVSTDSPAWSGGYTLDYNFEMPFQGLFSSNHADIAQSYYPQV